MEKRNYTHVQMLLPEIAAMMAEGKTQREVAEYFGFKDKYVAGSGDCSAAKGRPRKDAAPRDVATEQAYEIARLRMENKLLRDFLQFAERK